VSVLRWKLKDPYDTTSAGTYTFTRNPRSMTSPFPERQVSSYATSAGKTLTYEGATPPKQWSFSGPILHKGEIDALYNWVYNKKRRILLTDHFGRQLTLVMQSMDVQPARRTGYYWSHDYTVTALVLDISAPTVTDVGPRP
jgi:hypothetical protein